MEMPENYQTCEDLEERLEELRPDFDEYEFLQMLIYHIHEGMIEIEDGRLYPLGEGDTFDV